jgi:predicted anti-sigma-YlaC factor YlaD
MNCGYGEKLVLYFYGETAAGLKAGVESHLQTCAACRGELAALTAAEGWLKAAPAEPSDATLAAVLRQARAGQTVALGFGSWTQALWAGALTAVMVVGFSLPARDLSPGLAWNSGLDSGLDSVEYSISSEQSEMSAAQPDWEYNYGLLEAESQQELG